MKIIILFKDPDGVHEGMREACGESLPEGLSESEEETLIEFRMEKAKDKLRKWIEYSEYLEVEFDLEAGTAKIKELK